MEESMELALSLATALAVGLLIGIERGWSDRDENEGERIAGIRTFSLIGLLGGVWAMLSREMSDWVIVLAFVAVSALIIVAHILDVREHKDIGTTTAFSMMLTFVLSAWAVFGHEIPALAVTVIVIALLGYKPMLHNFLRNMERKEIYAGIKLLIISVVLLPLLPNEGFGPWDSLNPYWIWWMVVLICGLSFVGYVAVKVTGNRMGTLLTAVAGGLASSTAVTISFAKFASKSRKNTIFVAGVLFATSIMFVRVLVEVAVVNYSMLNVIWIPAAVMFAGLLIGGGLLIMKDQKDEELTEKSLNLKNPFQIDMGIKFGLFLGLILVLSEGMKEWYGDSGIYILSVISGLVSVNAITLTLSNMAKANISAEVATMGIILASATNALVKGLIFAFIAGIKASLRLMVYMILAMIPGLLTAYYLLS